MSIPWLIRPWDANFCLIFNGVPVSQCTIYAPEINALKEEN